MNRTARGEIFGAYLDEACRLVRDRDRQGEIRLELGGHLEEIADRLREEGMNEEAAAREAIRQMGDPRTLGRQLRRVHGPKTEWSLIALALLLVGVSIAAMHAVQLGAKVYEAYRDIPFVAYKSLFACVGIAAMALLSFVDYRKIRKLAWPIYLAGVLVLLLPHWLGIPIAGQQKWFRIGSLGINAAAVAPYLFMIALAGLPVFKEHAGRLGWNRIRGYLQEGILFFALPGWLYMGNSSLIAFAIHVIGASAILLARRNGWKRWFFYAGSLAAVAVGFILMPRPYAFGPDFYYYSIRIRALILSFGDRTAYSYFYSGDAMSSADFRGHGFGHAAGHTPYFYSENIFGYLTNGWGWGAGLLLAGLLALFILRATRVAARTSDSYARRLTIGLTSILGAKLAWSLLMSAGVLPYVGIQMPFISYNGIGTSVELAAVGILLGAYRRQNGARWNRTPRTAS